MGEILPTQSVNIPALSTSIGKVLDNRQSVTVGRIAKLRRKWIIQNVGTNPLFVSFNSIAVVGASHCILKAGLADFDGLGGSISEEGVSVFQGEIYVAGSSPKYFVTEFL